MAHRNAHLTPRGRLTIVLEYRSGYSAAQIAAGMRVARATVAKWLRRYTAEGPAGLEDRSSCPHTSPRTTDPDVEAQVVSLRVELAYGPARIAHELGLATSTVYRVLCRHGLNRLDLLHRTTREPIRRYERARPGELIHMGMKKLGRIPPGGGRHHDPRFIAGEIGDATRTRTGYDTLHVAIDDHSRLAYVEVLPDAGKHSASLFLRHTLQAFAAVGIRVERVLTDNDRTYSSNPFRELAAAAGVGLRRTRPRRPQTNGKAERFIQTLLREWAYVQHYASNDARTLALTAFLDRYNFHRPHSAIGHRPPATRVNNLYEQHS